MSGKRKTDEDQAKASPASDRPMPRSTEEAAVWKCLEQARQNVKPIVKKEQEAEVVTGDLLNLRLKGC